MKVLHSVAVVTGAAQGIGKAIAETLIKNGAKVTVSDINENLGKATSSDLNDQHGPEKSIFVKCDVTQIADIRNVFTKTKSLYGKVDILINNAGIINEVKWEQMIDINLNGMIRGTDVGLEFMGRNSGGSGGIIINMASLAGITPVSAVPKYAATKHGVVGLTRALGTKLNFEKHNVRVNCVCPSMIDTTINNVTESQTPEAQMYIDSIKAIGTLSPQLVADAVMMLIEDDSKNGQAITISHANGIQYAKLPYAKF